MNIGTIHRIQLPVNPGQMWILTQYIEYSYLQSTGLHKGNWFSIQLSSIIQEQRGGIHFFYLETFVGCVTNNLVHKGIKFILLMTEDHATQPKYIERDWRPDRNYLTWQDIFEDLMIPVSNLTKLISICYWKIILLFCIVYYALVY